MILELIPSCRAVVGSLGSSFLADKFGRKLVYAIAFMVMLIGITLETVATTNSVFFAGKFINGFAVGAFGTVTMTYLGEVRVFESKTLAPAQSLQISPLATRGIVTAAAGLSYTFGPFIVTLLQNSYGNLNSRWAYRGIFVSQYGVTLLGLIGLPFVPE